MQHTPLLVPLCWACQLYYSVLYCMVLYCNALHVLLYTAVLL